MLTSLAVLTAFVAVPESGAADAAALTGDALVEALTSGGSNNYRKTVRYDLEASLDVEARTVTAAGRVLWTNHGTVPVNALWWHLYLNAFKNDQSTFMRESNGGKLRGDEFDRENWGWIEVTKLMATPPSSEAEPMPVPANILIARTFEHPDDDNVRDQTVMKTPLPFAVGPGETVSIDVAFTSKLPKVFARSGYSGSFHMVAQWFPKLGVLDETFTGTAPDGEPPWNCHQYHAASEYFADYGAFHVAIDVPEGFVVGASGARVSTERRTPGRVTYVHDVDRVHDFAWTADSRFVEIERDFVASKEVAAAELSEVATQLRVAPSQLRLTDVKVKLLIQPEHEAYAERYFKATFAAIKWFGLWYGAYPYPTLTVVDGPRGARGAMGMEYPTLITGGIRWPVVEAGGNPELVTVHEFGHQYWYGLVGSNEFEESWLDEGFNTYSTGKVTDKVYGPFSFPLRLGGWPLTPWMDNELTQLDIAKLGTMTNSDDDAIVRPSWMYRTRRSYGVNSYPRSALSLRQLENVVGEDALLRAMRLYHQRWRYRHPRTRDFIAAVEEVHGQSLGDWFDRAIRTPDGVDYAITGFTSDRRKTSVGVFDADPSATGTIAHDVVTKDEAKRRDLQLESTRGGSEAGTAREVGGGEDETSTSSDSALSNAGSKTDMDAAAREAGTFDTTVYVRRRTSVDFPVSVEVEFEGGTKEVRTWDGRYRWARFEFVTKAKAVSARLHPHGGQLLDLNRTNDTRRLEKDHRAGLTWGAHALYVVQTLWQFVGGTL